MASLMSFLYGRLSGRQIQIQIQLSRLVSTRYIQADALTEQVFIFSSPPSTPLESLSSVWVFFVYTLCVLFFEHDRSQSQGTGAEEQEQDGDEEGKEQEKQGKGVHREKMCAQRGGEVPKLKYRIWIVFFIF